MNIQSTFKLTILPLAIMLLASQLVNPTVVKAQGPPDGVSGPDDGGVIDPWGGLDCINGYAVDGPGGWYCACDPGWMGSTCDELEDIYRIPPGGGGGGMPSQETVPHAPSNVTIIEKTDTSIKLEWRDRSFVETGFKLERQESGGDWALVVDHLDPVNGKFGWSNYPDEPLTPDTQFCYRVVPYNDFGSPLYVPEVCAYTDRPEPTGTHLATLRVLTHNVYGFDDDGIFGDGGAFGLGTGFLDNHCEERAKAFGEAVAIANPPYDIVGVQEYYNIFDFEIETCDSSSLFDAIQSKGGYPNYHLFEPNGETLQWGPEVDGGLGIFSRHLIVESEGEEWDETYYFGESPVQGILFARIMITGTGVTVDTYVVHTYSRKSDPCDRACHEAELQQLADKVAALSRSSGNPVLIMGDFNINGPPGNQDDPGCRKDECQEEDYENIVIEALHDPLDLWFDNHPGEMGFTSDGCWSGLPSNCEKKGKRIDYIFVPTDPSLTDNPYEIFIRNRDDVRVVVWSDGFGIHVSDHYGVEATIEIWERETVRNQCQRQLSAYNEAVKYLEARERAIDEWREKFHTVPSPLRDLRLLAQAKEEEAWAGYQACLK